MFDAVGKTGWTDKMKRCSAMQVNPQQPIKTRKMVHVRVGHETMGHAQQLARRKRSQITEIEQQRAAAEPEIDEQPWIGKRLIDKRRLNEPAH